MPSTSHTLSSVESNYVIVVVIFNIMHPFFYLLIFLMQGANTISDPQGMTSPAESSCKPKTNTGKLKEAVFCGYNPTVRPVLHHTNQTVVKFSPFPTHISWSMEDRNGIYLGFWVYIHWQDDLLVWNSSDYDGLAEFYTEPGKIWSPDIIVSDPPQPSGMTRQMNCDVNNKGFVECTTTATVVTHCNFNFKYFPFDRHSCKVVFQSQSYKGSELDIDFIGMKNSADSLRFYRSHGVWDLMAPKYNRVVTHVSNDVHIIELELTFDIERRSSSNCTICTIPALVIIMMTLSVFWLEIQSSARIILPALTIVSDVIIMQWLMNSIHAALTRPPLILLYFRDNLLFTGLALVWTIVARTVCSSSFSPHWLHMVSTNLNKNNFVRFILPEDIFLKSGASGDEDESSLVVHRDCVEQQWRILMMLGDRVLFGLYILIFMYYFMVLSP